MARCRYCEQEAIELCGICQAHVCKKHSHPVNRWHNVFHASWICEDCYRVKERKRKYVLIPIVVLFMLLIAQSMNVKWGLQEPVMWLYFSALSSTAAVILAMALVYRLSTGKHSVGQWAFNLGTAVFLAVVFFIIYRLTGN